MGQPVHLLSPLVPSTYLLCGCYIEMGQHQKFAIKWAIVTCLVMLVAQVLFGIFPLYSTLPSANIRLMLELAVSLLYTDVQKPIYFRLAFLQKIKTLILYYMSNASRVA